MEIEKYVEIATWLQLGSFGCKLATVKKMLHTVGFSVVVRVRWELQVGCN
jgi:hypothetical protein